MKILSKTNIGVNWVYCPVLDTDDSSQLQWTHSRAQLRTLATCGSGKAYFRKSTGQAEEKRKTNEKEQYEH